MKGRLLLVVLLGLIVGVSLAMSLVVLARDFSDVEASHWAYPYINELTEKGIINGYEDGSYRPDGTVTRAEFIKLMCCSVDSFTTFMGYLDESEELSGEFVNWWDKYAYVTDNIFGANPYEYNSGDYKGPITREEMANILLGFLRVYDLDVEDNALKEEDFRELDKLKVQICYDWGWIDSMDYPIEELMVGYNEMDDEWKELVMSEVNERYEAPELPDYSGTFTDIEELDGISQKAIAMAKKYGVINGYEDGTFRPENNMTRAEVAVVISNFLKVDKGV